MADASEPVAPSSQAAPASPGGKAAAPPKSPRRQQLTKDELKASSQRLAASGKRERPASAPPPGPGQYNPQPVNKHRPPGYSFGKQATKPAWAPTSPKPPLSEPGPVPEKGRDPKSPGSYKPPQWSFGKTTRQTGGPEQFGSAEVGPGSYDPKKQSYRAPRWHMSARPPPTKPNTSGTEAGDLFGSAYIVSGNRGDAPKKKPPGQITKSAADLPDGEGGEGAEGAAAAEGGGEGGEAAGAAGASTAVVKAPATGSAGFKENLDGALEVDWKALSSKLPTGKDEASKAKRKALWKRADPNGNGFLSSAEVDLMVRDTVGEEMFSAKPVIQSAFHAARKSGGGAQTGRAGDYIERKEFRTLLIMLRQYYELYAMFNRLDTSDDRRIDNGEFKQGAEMVASWGVKLEPGQLDAEFASIDTDGGGKILFDEFASWGILKALDLEEDDNFDDGGETAKHEAVGYVEERDAKLGGSKHQIVTREPAPKMCYTHMGAMVPVQTMPKGIMPGDKAHSYSRAKASPVFRSKENGSLPIVGGLPFRKIMNGSKFMPNTTIAAGGTISGLPYALSQLLLEKSKEQRDAEAEIPKHLTLEDRAYGAETLEKPKKKDDKKALENKAAGSGSKASAKVAPA